MATDRLFPLQPRSTLQLKVGDIIAVPGEPTGWACLVVVEVWRRGTGARTTFIVGVVDWSGEQAPREPDVAGLPVIAQALTRTELFTEGGLAVVGNVGAVATTFDSNHGDYQVGAKHRVWGWKAAIRHARAQIANRVQ
ncbi:hypothetical protein ACFM35_00040 [Microbacterium sp. P01]|uniref:hypothetical protein n=1 Tax=Microbacterium sp. P01 TaxID=3366261 RepID=UPI00366F15C5